MIAGMRFDCVPLAVECGEGDCVREIERSLGCWQAVCYGE